MAGALPRRGIRYMPQLFKTVQHGLHRTRVRLLVTVEIHRTIREHGKTGHKAHHCSRKTAEHLRTTVEPAVGRRRHRNRGVDLLIDFAAHSHARNASIISSVSRERNRPTNRTDDAREPQE